MEVPNVHPASNAGFSDPSHPPFYSNNDLDMDIDMDMDLGLDPSLAAMEAEAMAMDTQTPIHTNGAVQATFDPAGAVPADAVPVPEKLHVRGLDNLTTNDIKQFVSENFASEEPFRVEWIDDTSANLVYEAEEVAANALNALSALSDIDPASIPPLTLRAAKQSSSRPDTQLSVRQATTADRKKPRAHESSRFYLMNPELDPREQKRRHGQRRGRMDEDEDGDYRRRRFDEREHRRRKEGGRDLFDENMYDDDGAEANGNERPRRRGSEGFSSAEDRGGRRRVRFGGRSRGDLFDNRGGRSADGRLRNRSASPGLEGDGRMGFDEDESASLRRRIRQRSLTPPRRTRNGGAINTSKELFPAPTRMDITVSTQPSKELFPTMTSPKRGSRELFPHKASNSHHRRTEAFDAGRLATPDTAPRNRSLADRITKERSLADRITGDQDGLRIRGNARAAENGGLNIKGTASGLFVRGAAQANAPAVKELFPFLTGGSGNEGKELFGERIKGRAEQRRKADTFF